MTNNRTTTANSLIWNRRQLLQTAGVGFGSLAFHHLLQRDGLLASETPDTNLQNPLAAKNPHIPAKAKSVIFLFAYGGPSQVDSLDPKPALEKWQGKSILTTSPNVIKFTENPNAGCFYGGGGG